MQLSTAQGPRPNKHQLRSERTRQTILDAAEPLFAPYGLASVSLRQIALAAGVDLTLVSYHFESKAALYNAVVQRIADDFTRRRAALLDELERNTPAPTAVELFDVLITAWFEIRFGRAPHRARLLVHGPHLEPGCAAPERGEPAPGDDDARRFLDALARAEPGRPLAYLHRTYHCFTGALVYWMRGDARVERLSGDYCDARSPEAIRQVLLEQVRNAFPA